MSVLMLSFTAGCVTQKTGVAASTAKVEESPISHDDSGSLPKTVNKIWVNPKADAFEVWIQASGPLNDYTSIKQSFPFAVSVYLSNVHLARGLVDAGYFSDSRVSDITVGFIDKAQTTVKVDILLKADLPYIVEEKPDRLGIIIKGSQSLSEQSAKAGSIADESGQGWKDVVEPSKDVSIPGTAHLTHIEFDSNNLGESDVQILTDHPVRYETVQTHNDSLGLILYNTTVPLHHQRPLLSRYFNSAVEQVMPRPNPANPNDTLVDIKIREKVPFQVVQTTKGIHVIFQAPNVSAPEFDQVKVSSDAGKNTHPGLKKYDQGESTTQAKRPSPDQDPLLNPSSVRYTGEKIKLDFYETDIKNVFRILKSVAGVNFAIDRDVQGKVTLTLQDPVPWDQILDLILKMNDLGKKMEGNVIRIATTETLAKEETQRQEAIAARQKSEEQKQALEPLVTEYIPVNYSDAKKDIEAHVSKILTPNRGKISVDARTNQLIITDTQAKIDQAFELINRLDTVTPQIMIEAKVVEVTKEFSRSFGINWNLSNASNTTSGFVDDFSVSVNTSGVSGDFSFFGLFGSSVSALNAKLAASEEQGDVRIVSSPRILTLDNKKAMIKQGQQYAYQELNSDGTAGVAFKDIDLLLEVTPHVTPDNRISMNVRLTKNDVGPETTEGVPSLVTNEAETELLVNNNDTVVIGGVIKSTQSQDTDGVPFLANLPGLGYLFGTNAKVDNRNELLIFLTPSIVQLEQKRHIIQ
ncbi:type IV pilus secretin PilQ [Desulfobacter postgatei]|uniref:type IV pilus secretin PilQ n=1 Tax=Desulfobacter postgatei TaxID=2293 RepID=UPI00259B0056|nr:type IV pilus secretin PilQ [uncultured Desulfobacter sp.]